MLNSRINIFCWRKNRERKRTTCHIQPSHQCSFIYWTKKERKRTPSHAELSHQCYLNTEQRKREKSSCHIQLSHKCSFIYWTRERRKKNFMSSCALASLLFRFPGYLTWACPSQEGIQISDSLRFALDFRSPHHPQFWFWRVRSSKIRCRFFFFELSFNSTIAREFGQSPTACLARFN